MKFSASRKETSIPSCSGILAADGSIEALNQCHVESGSPEDPETSVCFTGERSCSAVLAAGNNNESFQELEGSSILGEISR